MKFEVKWIPLENKRPPLYAGRVWVATKDGKVSLDEPVVDTYFGEERLKWRDKGFQDLAECNNHECNWVTHWAKYVEPFPPDPPNALEPLLGPGDERYHGPRGKVMKVNKEALIANPPPEPSEEARCQWESDDQTPPYQRQCTLKAGHSGPHVYEEESCGIVENATTSTKRDTRHTAKTVSPFGELLLEWPQLSKESQGKVTKWFQLASERLQIILGEQPPAPDWAEKEAREYLDANLGRATDTGIAALLRRVAERQREEDQSIVRLNARTHQEGIDLAAAIRKGKK